MSARVDMGFVLVAMTRRSAPFNEMAQAVEQALAAREIVLEADIVDQILRNRIDRVAELMRVSPRTAIGYAPEDLPRIIADSVLEAITGAAPSPPAPGRHLSVVPRR